MIQQGKKIRMSYREIDNSIFFFKYMDKISEAFTSFTQKPTDYISSD